MMPKSFSRKIYRIKSRNLMLDKYESMFLYWLSPNKSSMEIEPYSNVKKKNKKKSGNSLPNSRYFFQSPWIRYSFRSGNKVDRIIRDYRYCFLFHISFIFWVILLLKKKTIKKPF